MQFTTTLAAAAGLTTLASASVLPRTTETFNIKYFSFSGVPHSITAFYSFNVTDGSTTDDVLCQTTTSTSPEITTFGLTACSDPYWSFAWEPLNESNNTQVRIVRQPQGLSAAYNETAVREFTPADIKEEEGTTPTGNVYFLSTGDDGGDFALTATSAL